MEKNKNIYKIEIPFRFGKEVVEQDIFLLSANSPTKKQVLKVLTDLHNRNYEYDDSLYEYDNSWRDCIKVVENCIDFPFLYSTMYLISTQINIEGFEKTYPLSVTKITPIEIGE